MMLKQLIMAAALLISISSSPVFAEEQCAQYQGWADIPQSAAPSASARQRSRTRSGSAGKQVAGNLNATEASTLSVTPGYGRQLPPCRLDSLVADSQYDDHIYGDEGSVYGLAGPGDWSTIGDGLDKSGPVTAIALSTGHAGGAPTLMSDPGVVIGDWRYQHIDGLDEGNLGLSAMGKR